MLTHKEFFDVWDHIRDKFPAYIKDRDEEMTIYDLVVAYKLDEETFKKVCREIYKKPVKISPGEILLIIKEVVK